MFNSWTIRTCSLYWASKSIVLGFRAGRGEGGVWVGGDCIFFGGVAMD